MRMFGENGCWMRTSEIKGLLLGRKRRLRDLIYKDYHGARGKIRAFS